MFRCLRKEIASHSGARPSETHYCYHCFTWVTGDDWGPHCRSHLTALVSKRCGAEVYCHTLVRPAYCPFCLGKDQLSSSERMQWWNRDHQLWEHVGRHMRDCHYPTPCPHPLCETSLPDSKSLEFHFIDGHSISRTRPKDTTFKSQPATPQPSFVVVDPEMTLKRRFPHCSRSEKPSKRPRVTTATTNTLPLHPTPAAVENPDSGHSSAARQDFPSPAVFNEDYDDLFAQFIHTPTSAGSDDETAVSVQQDALAKQRPSLPGEDRDDGQQPAEAQETQAIRIRLRVPPPKPKVTLRLTKPKAKTGSKSIFKKRWRKGR